MQLSHCWAIMFVSSSLHCKEKNCLKIIKHAVEKMSARWRGWGWWDFVAMETVLTHHLFVIFFLQDRKEEQIKAGTLERKFSLSSWAQTYKDLLYVLVIMSLPVIIINQIKLYCQKQIVNFDFWGKSLTTELTWTDHSWNLWVFYIERVCLYCAWSGSFI